MKEERIDTVHQFWFKGIDDQTPIDKNKDPFQMWFTKSGKTDQKIKESFEEDLQAADQDLYKDWEDTLKGRLALILLCDQFSRNIYRGSAQMFAYDERALALSLQTINEKKDRELMLIERVFLYLPLEHNEDVKMQEMSLKYFHSLIEESKTVNPANTGYYAYTYDWAKKHYDVIERFGRFPHRNALLNRTSTKEEEEYLSKPGSGF